jgi:hypothetical protein
MPYAPKWGQQEKRERERFDVDSSHPGGERKILLYSDK